MKRMLLLLSGCLLVIAGSAEAQRFQGRFVTSGYVWQRSDTVDVTSTHVFGFQLMQLSLATENVTVQTYLQVFNDFAGPLKNRAQGRVYNLFAQWRNIGGLADVSVGRQYIFAGVGNGGIDGGSFTLRFLNSRVRVLGYGGALVPAGQKSKFFQDMSDNFMVGGRVRFEPVDFATISLSFVQKDIKPKAYSAIRGDSITPVYSVEIKPTASAEQYLGADFDVSYNRLETVNGRLEYDMYLEKLSRIQLFTRVRVLDRLAVTGEFLQRDPRLRYNSIFSVFSYNTLHDYEGGIEYEFLPGWNAVAQLGSVSYGDESNTQLTLGVNGKYVGGSLSHTTGYNGKISSASLNAGYPLMNRMLTPTLLLSYAQYKLSDAVTDLDAAFAMGIGLVYRPMPVLSVDGQLQWITNKIYQNDVRLMLRASYLMSETLNLF